jgi:hypothetical protein
MVCKCGSVRLANAAVCRMISHGEGCYWVEVYAPDDKLLKGSAAPLPLSDALAFIHESITGRYYPHFHWDHCATGAEVLHAPVRVTSASA